MHLYGLIFSFYPGIRRTGLCFLLCMTLFRSFAQEADTMDFQTKGAKHELVVPGKEYKAGRVHQFLWGRDYRQEWTTPVSIPLLNIDTAYGGLIPLSKGGGRQTKS